MVSDGISVENIKDIWLLPGLEKSWTLVMNILKNIFFCHLVLMLGLIHSLVTSHRPLFMALVLRKRNLLVLNQVRCVKWDVLVLTPQSLTSLNVAVSIFFRAEMGWRCSTCAGVLIDCWKQATRERFAEELWKNGEFRSVTVQKFGIGMI